MKSLIPLSITLFLLIFSTSFSVVHEHYVGITTIEYNQTTKGLEVSIQLTAHDVEFALEKMGYGALKLGAVQENRIADNILFKYLKENFELTTDGKKQSLHWVGKEVGADDILWLYVEVQGVLKPHKLLVFNKLLLDEFPAQQNIVHVKVGNTIQSATLDARLKEKEFEL